MFTLTDTGKRFPTPCQLKRQETPGFTLTETGNRFPTSCQLKRQESLWLPGQSKVKILHPLSVQTHCV